MPQEVFIPSKNKTLTFADDFSEQEIGDYIDSNFPRTGEDVSYDLKNRLLDPSWNPSYDDFEKLRAYNKQKDIDTAEVVSSIYDGAVQMGKNLLGAIPAAVSDPASIPGSLVRGLANNIKNYEILAQGGTSTGTPLFELMNGDSATAYSTWRDSINAARSLHETSNAAIAGLPVNPEQVAGAEVIADPMNFVPMVGIGGKGGALAAKAVGKAGQVLEGTGKAAVRIATVPEKMVAKAAEKLAGVPADVAERTAQDLATKAAIVDVAAGVIPGAAEIGVTKAAGAATAAAGEAISAAAAEAAQGAGMLSSVEKAAANPALSTGARAILNVTARLIPRDAALVASDALKAGLIGAGIGGGLGYLQSRDEEEIGQAIGGGLAAGTIIGGGLKLHDVASGKVAKERVLNDAARNIARAAASGESEADLGFRANLFSKLAEGDRKGEGLGTFLVMEDLISQRGGKVKVVDGEVLKGPNGETGWNAFYDPKDKTIYVNNKGSDATTVPHEAVHFFLSDVLADELTSRLFSKDAQGRLQQTATDGAIATLIEGYLKDADNIKLQDGTTEGERLRKQLEAAFDPNTPTSEQVSRLRDITHEIAARYAENWVTKKGPRDFLPGAMPTIWSEAVSVARGKLERLFGKDTGNQVLDPLLKRIFSPKESGVPDKKGVPLDPRTLTQDWSDKKGRFMVGDKRNDAFGAKHWNPVAAVAFPILEAAGASRPQQGKYERNRLSLRGVGEDVIDQFTRTNIDTPLKSSAPILSVPEAEFTKMAIRAMQTGEMLQFNNYMSFLTEGKAESGIARNGNPVDKRFAVVDVHWSKDNGVQILAVDIGSALNKLAADVRSKGSASGFDSVGQANKALSQYLRHVADSEGNFDAAKKGWEIEVDGKPMGKTAHKTLHEALNFASPQDKVPYRPDINIQRQGINRISGIEFILPRRVTGNGVQTGVVTPLSNKGIEAIQLRFQPNRTAVEKLPNGMVAQDADGARIIKTDTSGYRLFDPLGERIGIYRTLEQAAEAATRQAENDLATVKEVQYAIQEQRAKEVSVRQRAQDREAVRQGNAQGQEVAGVRFQPTKEEIEIANRTARTGGAVGEKAITVQYVAQTIQPGDTVLNFGAGKPETQGPLKGKYRHSEIVRQAGGIVNEYDFGGNATGSTGKQHDVVFASNVLNVQQSDAMLRSTLRDIRNFAIDGGRIVFNYPASPRKWFIDGKKASQNQVARVIAEEYGVQPRVVGGTSSAPIWEVNVQSGVRFQPKRREEKLPKTPFAMGQQIQAQARAAKQADVAQVRSRILGEGAGSSVERAVAQEAMAREAELFARPKKIAISDEQLTAIRDAGIMETYVRALLNFEDAYTKMTGQAPVGKAYQSQAMKMTKRQQDAILRLAMSNDTPQARLAIEAAREAADPAMRAAIERMLGAQERVAALPKAEQTLGVEDVKRSLQAVLPQGFGAPEIRGRLESRQAIRRQVEGAMRDVRAQGEAEAAQMRQATEAKFDEAAAGVAQEAAKVSAEIADQFKALKKEIAAAEEVISSETDAINPARIILKMKGKYRLYGANAGLIGVFRTKEEAVKKASKK